MLMGRDEDPDMSLSNQHQEVRRGLTGCQTLMVDGTLAGMTSEEKVSSKTLFSQPFLELLLNKLKSSIVTTMMRRLQDQISWTRTRSIQAKEKINILALLVDIIPQVQVLHPVRVMGQVQAIQRAQE
jgi:hypothetical protein